MVHIIQTELDGFTDYEVWDDGEKSDGTPYLIGTINRRKLTPSDSDPYEWLVNYDNSNRTCSSWAEVNSWLGKVSHSVVQYWDSMREWIDWCAALEAWQGDGWYRIGWSDGGMDWTSDGALWFNDAGEIYDELRNAESYETETHLAYAEWLGDGDEPKGW